MSFTRFRSLRVRHLVALAPLALSFALACGPAARPAPREAKTTASSASQAPPPAPAPPAFSSADVDKMLDAAWQKESLVPAPRADDATFVRRAYLDVVGRIPTPEVAKAFVADGAPDKRAKLVDALLASPEYAAHWTEYWDDVLMGRDVREPVVDRAGFRAWLRARFTENTPWNKIVAELVSAKGQNSAGGPRSRVATPLAADAGAAEEPDGDVNPAVNWGLRFIDAPQDLAGNASRTFLGVQIQCAQCHDHKTEKWKQEDFRRFASAILHAGLQPIDRGKPMGMIRRVEVRDLPRVAPRVAAKPDLAPIATARAAALDGTDLERGADTRKELARWMIAPENPFFARAFVNRMWGHFMGRGFVDPVDDMRPSNPAAAPEILDALAADFVKSGYDVKRLVRLIANTRAYGLAASAQAKTDPGNHLWANFRLTPLGPEELLNAIFIATDVETAARRAGIQNVDQLRAQVVRQFTFLFDVDEEFDSHDYAGTVTQALTLLNGALVGHGSRALPGSALEGILASSRSPEETIDGIYWRVLARPPTPEERAEWTKYVQDATNPAPAAAKPGKPVPIRRGGNGPLERLAGKNQAGGAASADPKRAAYEDVFWALLNTSEFLFNH